MDIRVYYEDTDCGNVVYYANYLRYMERARTELLRDIGCDLHQYIGQGIQFVVVDAHVMYKAPARYNDIIQIDTVVSALTGATMEFTSEIYRKETKEFLVKGVIKAACIKENKGPMRIPAEMYEKLKVSVVKAS